MPNKFARAVPVADYKPQGLLPEGLIPIARPDGSAAAEMSAASQRVANTFGAIADEAAQHEGSAAGKVAGLNPDYRPTGSGTIRGGAYDDAATKTYIDNLDAGVRTDLQRVYEANKGDPAALKRGFDTLSDEYRTQHVFPEIMGQFNAQFTRLRLPYENKALADLEENNKSVARGSLIENLTASQTNAGRAAAADPNNPATAQTVVREALRMDSLVDQAVLNESITPEQGAKLKISNRNSIVTRASTAQAEALASPELVAAYRENARKKFAAGEFKGLTAEGYDDLDSKLEAIERQKRTAGNAGTTLLQKNVNDYVQRAAEGFPIADDEWTRYASSPAATLPKGKTILDEGQAKLSVASVLRNRSVEDGERLVTRMRTELQKDGGATESQAEVVRFAEKYVKDQRTAINTDQLGLAARKGIVPAVSPLDFQGFAASNDPGAGVALAVQFRERTAQARSVAGTLSRAPQFLRPEEKDRLKEIVDQGGPKALELAGAIVKGSDTDAPMILREISGDAPLLAQAGNIIANGGSISAARDAFEASKIKAASGKDLPTVSSTIAPRVQRDTFGTAFQMQGEDAGRIRATADAIAATRINRGGVDPKSGEAESIYKRALQEAAGAQFIGGVQYGGVADYKPGYWQSYKVAVPTTIRADAFRDVIRAIRDDDLKTLAVPPQTPDGNGYSARDLAGAVPVAVRGGYRFAMGDPSSNDPKFIRGADGNAFVLPFEALDRMAPRVGGAFLGTR